MYFACDMNTGLPILRSRIYLAEMLGYFPYKTKKSCGKWCDNNGVSLFRDAGTKPRYAYRFQFEEAYGRFIQLQTINTQIIGVQVNIDKRKSRVIMDGPMVKPLHIPSSKKWKGLVVYCYQCNTNVYDVCRETGKPLEQCPFGNKHIFKVYSHVPGGGKARKTKALETRDVNEAIKAAIDFEREVKHGSVLTQPLLKQALEVQTPALTKEVLPSLEEAIDRYLAWLNNEDVPSFMQVERSEDYIKDIQRKLNFLKTALVEKGYDPSALKVEEIDSNVLSDVYDFFNESSTFANRTYNKHFSYYSSFIEWFSNEYYKVTNWFEKVKRKRVTSKPVGISRSEHEALLSILTPENGIARYAKGVKSERNFYRHFLPSAYRLLLLTGRRREEVLNMRMSDIVEFSPGIGYIKVEDLKVNHIEKRKTEEEKIYHAVPLTDELYTLLNELGFQERNGTDSFILAPEVSDKRNKVMADLLSRSFSHYYKQLNTGRELTLKSYRKRYITSMAMYLTGNELASKIIGHTNKHTTDKYYLINEETAAAYKGFKVFPPELERSEELSEVRGKYPPEKQNPLEK